jgi:hypothetical protein
MIRHEIAPCKGSIPSPASPRLLSPGPSAPDNLLFGILSILYASGDDPDRVGWP